MTITVTDRAARKIGKMMKMHKLPETACLQLTVQPGCDGHTYSMGILSGPGSDDTVCRSNGINVAARNQDADVLDGTVIDFADEMLRGNFVIHNPNDDGACSCGGACHG
jgi:iron-sulfur cluster assembly protein